MSNVVDLFPGDGPGWEQQQDSEERQRWELEQATEKLRELIRGALDEGVARIEDLEEDEIKQMTAAAIRAADPQRAWHFIGMAPNSGSYPGLVADALERKFGGYLGLEKTDRRLVNALLSGAVKYALHIIEEELEREIGRRQRQQ